MEKRTPLRIHSKTVKFINAILITKNTETKTYIKWGWINGLFVEISDYVVLGVIN